MSADIQSTTPIYLISLPESRQRRDLLSQRFPRHSKNWKQITAYRPGAKQSDETAKLYHVLSRHAQRARPMAAAEIACTASHITALRTFLRTRNPHCIILEDDVIGCDRMLDKAGEILKRLPETHLILLGGMEGLKGRKHLYGKPFRAVQNVYEIPKIMRHFLSRACCYGVSRDMASQLIDSQISKLTTADHWSQLTKNCSYVFFSPLLQHPTNSVDSELEAARLTKRKGYLAQVYSDGIATTAYRNLAKIFYPTYARIVRYKRVYK